MNRAEKEKMEGQNLRAFPTFRHRKQQETKVK
jgi:hypothetical protein